MHISSTPPPPSAYQQTIITLRYAYDSTPRGCKSGLILVLISLPSSSTSYPPSAAAGGGAGRSGGGINCGSKVDLIAEDAPLEELCRH